MKKTWGIIGLGWLGQKLSQKLNDDGIKVWGTHRDTFSFESNSLPRTFCDVLFLNTPPLTNIPAQAYAEKVLENSAAKIIFISSTSVYTKNVGRVIESDTPLPDTKSGQWLLDVETILFEENRDRVTVIRPGGLIGGERHPVRSLSGRMDVPNGDHVVNLIHRDDLISIICASDNFSFGLINAVSPFHPTRELYYNQWAQKLKIPGVDFARSVSPDRIVDSKYLEIVLPDWKCRSLDFI